MKIKNNVTILFSCLAILGFAAAVQAENHDYDRSYEGSGHTRNYGSSAPEKYYAGSHDSRDGRQRVYGHKIFKEIRKNEKKIWKLQRKINGISKHTHYRGHLRHSDVRRIKRLEWEIKRLERRNHELKRLLKRSRHHRGDASPFPKNR